MKAFQEKLRLQRYLYLNNYRVSLSVKRFSHVNFREESGREIFHSFTFSHGKKQQEIGFFQNIDRSMQFKS